MTSEDRYIRNVLVVLAGGMGTRYRSDIPKQFTKINNVEVLHISMSEMMKSELTDRIILVMNDDKDRMNAARNVYNADVIVGGKDRAHSFQNALDYIYKNYPTAVNVVFHEAARPLVTYDVIDRYFGLLRDYDYVETCEKIVDSLGSYVINAPKREEYYLIQAPEAYRINLLRKYYDCGSEIYFAANQFPDSCKGYHFFGVKDNIKLTTQHDLAIISTLLQSRVSHSVVKTKNKRALVLAETNRDELVEMFPDISFDFMGYAENFVVIPHEKLKEIISGYDILVSEFDTIDKEIIDNAEKLKLLVCCRGGVHSVVDVSYAESKGIIVRNTPGRNAAAVAEYVIGQIIANDRFLAETNELIHKNIIQKEHFSKPAEYKDSLWGMDSNSPYHRFRGKGLSNITLGIVGYGKIGHVVTRMAMSLGMNVIVYDHSPQHLLPEMQIVSFSELLEISDIVSLHCTNRNHTVLMGENEFKKMKNGAWFINTARGDLVDETALIEQLNSGHIGKAILDVTRDEPMPLDSPLTKANNIVLTPHIAGATDGVIDNVTKVVAAYIRQFMGVNKHD